MLEQQIVDAKKEGKPIDTYVKQQIAILENARDEFVRKAQEKGYSLKNFRLGEIEIGQYSAMRTLAKKIGLPIEKYNEAIKQVKIRLFGEKGYKQFFENDDTPQEGR